jgi:hypothetical protein
MAKPGLSMVTMAAGRRTPMSATVCAMRRARLRMFGSTSTRPISASSRIGKRLGMPCSASLSPPMPAKVRSGRRARSAARRRAPSTSPEASPATM